MPLTGACAWKEAGIAPEERVDRFFNLIDHAVDNGISLSALYSRKHVKEFVLYVLHHDPEFCRLTNPSPTKDQRMSKLTVTNHQGSIVVVGDPGFFVVRVKPKESKTVDITDEHLRLLTPHLEKLEKVKWIEWFIDRPNPLGVVAGPAEPKEPLMKEKPTNVEVGTTEVGDKEETGSDDAGKEEKKEVEE